jgi:nucleoid DNA-binding protein
VKAVNLWRVLVQAGLEEAEARKRSEALASAVKAGIGSGRFEVRGFGAFVIRQRAARAGRNPMTGEPIAIAAKTAVAFKASPGLKKALIGEPPAVKTPDKDLQWTVLELIKALASGGDEASVKVDGLGTFRKALRAARTGRNPMTGASIQIAASAAVLFKADAGLVGSEPASGAAAAGDEGVEDEDEELDEESEDDA